MGDRLHGSLPYKKVYFNYDRTWASSDRLFPRIEGLLLCACGNARAGCLIGFLDERSRSQIVKTWKVALHCSGSGRGEVFYVPPLSPYG